MVTLGQAHGAEEQAHRDLAGEIVDELELLSFAYALKRAIGDIEGRRDELLDILARERGLAQCPQPIVPGRIGRPQGRPRAPGKLVDHVALRRREGLPIARRLYDVVVAGENPELAAFAPKAGILLAQDFVVRKGVGIDCRRIQIERFHHVAGNPAYFGSGRGYHGGCDQSLDRLFRRPITMSKASTTLSGEERLIARYFKPLAKHPGAFGLADDAAALTPPAGCDLVLKTDGIVAGVHFFPDDPAETVGKKALRANLSDLAAKGARPLGFLLTLALPHDIGDAWLAPFARGLGADAEAFACPLLGGDTDSTAGPITISIAAIGAVPQGKM